MIAISREMRLAWSVISCGDWRCAGCGSGSIGSAFCAETSPCVGASGWRLRARYSRVLSAESSSRLGWRLSHFAKRPSEMMPFASMALITAATCSSSNPEKAAYASISKSETRPRSSDWLAWSSNAHAIAATIPGATPERFAIDNHLISVGAP